MTARSPPCRLYATKAVGLLCICFVYIPLMFNIGSKTTIGCRCCGGGESFSKSSSFCCVCYAYALHKPLPRQVETVACPALLVLSFKSWHMLGLYITFIM